MINWIDKVGDLSQFRQYFIPLSPLGIPSELWQPNKNLLAQQNVHRFSRIR